MNPIRSAIHRFILDEFLPGEDPEALTDETPLITGGILDSISTLKLVGFLEDSFDVTLEAYEASADHLDTIRVISELIDKKRQAA